MIVEVNMKNMKTVLLVAMLSTMLASCFTEEKVQDNSMGFNANPVSSNLVTQEPETLAKEETNYEDWERFVTPSSAPTLKLTDTSGKEVDLANYKGKTVIVNFWASWCPPCVAELPSLNQLSKNAQDENLVVLTVNVQQDADEVLKFMQKERLQLSSLQDLESRTSKNWGVNSLPTTFIVGSDQKIRYVSEGQVNFDSSEMHQILDDLKKS